MTRTMKILSIILCCFCLTTVNSQELKDSLYKESKKMDIEGKLANQIELLEKVIRIDSAYLPAIEDLAYIYIYDQPNFLLSKTLLDKVEKDSLNPKFARIYAVRGYLLNQNNFYQEALIDLNIAIKLDSSNSDFYYNRGLVHNNLKNYSLAINDYTKALNINPLDGRVNYNRGLVYAAIREFDKAISDYSIDLKINGPTAKAHNNRGRCYMILNDFENALADYQKALELEPKRPLTLHNLGLLYLRNGDSKKGCPYLKEAKELGYPDTKIYDQYCK